jgi:hypothetical protein
MAPKFLWILLPLLLYAAYLAVARLARGSVQRSLLRQRDMAMLRIGLEGGRRPAPCKVRRAQQDATARCR